MHLHPTQNASHHQDYYILRLGNLNLNLHLPLLLGGERSKVYKNAWYKIGKNIIGYIFVYDNLSFCKSHWIINIIDISVQQMLHSCL